MRRLFIVFGKLLGLLVLYWGLSVVGWFCLSISQWLAGGESASAGSWWSLSYGAYLLLSLILALLLMFKTEKVADWLKLKKDEEIGKAPSMHQMLVTGLALIGVYALVSSIPSLVRDLLAVRAFMDFVDDFLIRFSAPVLGLALGLVLVVKPGPVARFIEKRTKETEPATEPDETPTRRVPGE